MEWLHVLKGDDEELVPVDISSNDEESRILAGRLCRESLDSVPIKDSIVSPVAQGVAEKGVNVGVERGEVAGEEEEEEEDLCIENQIKLEPLDNDGLEKECYYMVTNRHIPTSPRTDGQTD